MSFCSPTRSTTTPTPTSKTLKIRSPHAPRCLSGIGFHIRHTTWNAVLASSLVLLKKYFKRAHYQNTRGRVTENLRLWLRHMVQIITSVLPSSRTLIPYSTVLSIILLSFAKHHERAPPWNTPSGMFLTRLRLIGWAFSPRSEPAWHQTPSLNLAENIPPSLNTNILGIASKK